MIITACCALFACENTIFLFGQGKPCPYVRPKARRRRVCLFLGRSKQRPYAKPQAVRPEAAPE
jgi:hypothetical protein